MLRLYNGEQRKLTSTTIESCPRGSPFATFLRSMREDTRLRTSVLSDEGPQPVSRMNDVQNKKSVRGLRNHLLESCETSMSSRFFGRHPKRSPIQRLPRSQTFQVDGSVSPPGLVTRICRASDSHGILTGTERHEATRTSPRERESKRDRDGGEKGNVQATIVLPAERLTSSSRICLRRG